MEKFDNLIFDVDGTLVDSIEDIVNSMNYTLEFLDIKKKAKPEIISYIGNGVEYLIEKSLQEDISLFKKAREIFIEHYLQHCADNSKLYPNAADTLNYFKDKRKFIVTNREKIAADKILKVLNIYNYFEKIIGAENNGCVKPSACQIKKLGLNKKEKTLIIGDMDVDIAAGKNAGVKTCWVTYGLGKTEEVLSLNPDYVIDDLEQLKDIIE
jgi:HAD superfamily hydrolase (TIGR01549 family)